VPRLGVEPFRIGPGLPTRINPLAFGPLGDGWNRLDSEEALNRAAIVFGRWLTLVCGLLGSQRIGEHRVPLGPSDEVVVKAALQHLTGYRHGDCGAHIPGAATGDWGPPFQQRCASLLRSGVDSTPYIRSGVHNNGQDLSSLPNARPVVATAAGSVISGHLEPVYGNIASLRHGNGVVTRYGHLASIDPKIIPGPRMVIGQQIGSRAHRNEYRIAPSLPGRGQRHSGQPGPVHGRSRCTP
jgi:hypothetical protein